MMNIKNLLSFLLVLAMLATLGGCANPPEETVESSDGGMTIVAANFPAYDFARAVAGDANVTLLLPPRSEAHSYEPTPADVISHTGMQPVHLRRRRKRGMGHPHDTKP